MSSSAAALGREREAEEFVPYIGHVTPDVMLLTDERVMGMLHLAGVPFETADEADLNSLHQQLNVLFRNVASDRLAIYLHLVRGHDGYYPGAPSAPPSPASWTRSIGTRCSAGTGFGMAIW